MSPLLEIKDLNVEFVQRNTVVNHPIRGINLAIQPGEILGVVGETGCGKSLTGLAVLGLLPKGARAQGEIFLNGTPRPAQQPLKVRGKIVTLVFQNPMTAFNPLFTLGQQIDEVLKRHVSLSKNERRRRIFDYFTRVGLDQPERVFKSYPHQMSGGMLQRAMIAMALVSEPELLILDEPTTALDVTIAKQILDLISSLRESFGFGVMLITHNLGIVHDICDKIAVLYAGRVIETGSTEAVFSHPRHPYTSGLLGALPARHASHERLEAIPGSVPAQLLNVTYCAFKDRCARATEECHTYDPHLEPADKATSTNAETTSHLVACFNPTEE